MKPKPSAKPTVKLDQAMQAYEQQPEDKKELSRLKDEAEKTAGPARISIDKKIRAKSG